MNSNNNNNSNEHLNISSKNANEQSYLLQNNDEDMIDYAMSSSFEASVQARLSPWMNKSFRAKARRRHRRYNDSPAFDARPRSLGRSASVNFDTEKSLSYQRCEDDLSSDEEVDVRTMFSPPIMDGSHQSEVKQVKSSFSQSLFNTINMLLGVGILSLPYSFRSAGWLISGILLLLITVMCAYTGRLLGLIMEYKWELIGNRRPTSYPEIAEAAFGVFGRNLTSIVFALELFSACSMFIIIDADNLHKLFPHKTELFFGVVATGAMLLTTYSPNVTFLSNFSIIGVIASLLLGVSLIVEGFTEKKDPIHGGSITSPETTYLIASLDRIPLSFGLTMVVYAGHAVLPVIREEMKEPKRYNSMINLTFVFVLIVYALVASLGYIMFGNATEQEVTLNLIDVNRTSILTRATTWIIIIIPICKFALTLEPVAILFDAFVRKKPSFYWLASKHPLLLRNMNRTILVVGSLILAWQVPNFARVTSFVGSVFSYLVSLILPLLCYIRLFGESMSLTSKIFNWSLVIFSVLLSLAGTLASVFSPTS